MTKSLLFLNLGPLKSPPPPPPALLWLCLKYNFLQVQASFCDLRCPHFPTNCLCDSHDAYLSVMRMLSPLLAYWHISTQDRKQGPEMCTAETPMVWRGLVMGCSTVGSHRGLRLCPRRPIVTLGCCLTCRHFWALAFSLRHIHQWVFHLGGWKKLDWVLSFMLEY